MNQKKMWIKKRGTKYVKEEKKFIKIRFILIHPHFSNPLLTASMENSDDECK